MASTAAQLNALGKDPQFIARVQSLLIQEAAVIYAEVSQIPDSRRNLAKQILNNPSAFSSSIAAVIANRTNLVAGNTTYDWNNNHAVTDVTDASIQSQIATDWSMLAGV